MERRRRDDVSDLARAIRDLRMSEGPAESTGRPSVVAGRYSSKWGKSASAEGVKKLPRRDVALAQFIAWREAVEKWARVNDATMEGLTAAEV